MPKNKEEFSLLDSARFQNALRSNNLENIRMMRAQRKMENDRIRRENWFLNSNKALYNWAQQMKTTTGTTYHEHPDKIFLREEKKKEEDDVAPSYYFAYGMRIGERPKLLKNFLGTKRKNSPSRPIRGVTAPEIRHNESLSTNNGALSKTTVYSYFQTKQLEQEAEKRRRKTYRTFMYGNRLITQVPIGYSRRCRRPQTSFYDGSSELFRLENTVLPPYYHMKYRSQLPPADMFR